LLAASGHSAKSAFCQRTKAQSEMLWLAIQNKYVTDDDISKPGRQNVKSLLKSLKGVLNVRSVLFDR
jgi:hypothetical protein